MNRRRCFRSCLLVLGFLMLSISASAETIRVRVVDVDGKPVDGAAVTVVRSHDPRVTPPRSFTIFTKSGSVTLSNLLPGEHVIRVQAAGYLSVAIGGIVVEERLVPERRVGEIVVLLNPSSSSKNRG